jgi:hypothetical protein
VPKKEQRRNAAARATAGGIFLYTPSRAERTKKNKKAKRRPKDGKPFEGRLYFFKFDTPVNFRSQFPFVAAFVVM